MNPQEMNNLFSSALHSAERGDFESAEKKYEQCLRVAQHAAPPLAQSDLAKFVRSTAINLAQVLNKLEKFPEALAQIDLATLNSPTPTGWAIALAAKGEALCRLGRIKDGTQAFAEAVRAQPVIGSLNSADSMTRMKSTHFLEEAQRLIDHVLNSYGDQISPSLRAEAYTINGKIAVRRRDLSLAYQWFSRARREVPGYADAELQMQLLRTSFDGDKRRQ